jgi:hypothetical protein
MTRSRLATGVLASAVLSGLFTALPVISASAAPTDCPTAFPTASAVDGVTGTGYTVERGTTPEPFTATILGRVNDGIAPGVDMIMANLTSPALTRAGGVWEGMSGSPVYAVDGRLIGSVSYGLAASSPIAGITPASDMMALLSSGSKQASPSRIRISATAAKRIAKTGEVSTAAASGGFQRLTMPVTVSGSARNRTKFLKALNGIDGVHVLTGGSRITAAASTPSEITAGGNFAAALSYGDVSISGVGTTTFVCDGEAVAFGHPFFSLGNVQYSAHPATAVYVQPDPINGPFKVANPGGPVGVVDRDRTLGIRAELGAAATSDFSVTSSIVPNGASTVTGSTTGVYQPYAADIGALHLQANIIKALGAQGPGSAALTFTVKGTRAGGKAFTLTTSDHYADSADISYAAADDLYSLISPLLSQSFEDVKITSVQVTGSVSDTINQYRITKIAVKKKGQWVTQKGVLPVTAGKTIPTHVTLTRYRSSATVTVPLAIRVPTRSEGATGTLTISDGMESGVAPGDPTSLTGLLKQLGSAPSNDSVAGTLALDTMTASVTSVKLARTSAAVSFYSKDISVEVKV